MEMSTAEKLKILGAAAKYDVSCASSGVNRKNDAGGIGSTVGEQFVKTFFLIF